jgi:hypothetical protein
MSMPPLDYGHSFLQGRAPQNEVRFWVESRTRMIDEKADVTEDYLQCASCKSEDTFAPSDLFFPDNYDFLPIFGPAHGLVFRRKAWLNPGYRSSVPSKEMWSGQTYHLIDGAQVTELITAEQVLEATREFLPIVAQTEIRNSDTDLRAIIEYPVKTLNTRREDGCYQVDTGPVTFPDLSRRAERLVDLLSLAFVAFNAPHFADFVIEVPTAIDAESGPDSPQVHHYAQRVTLEAVNRLYAMG